MAGWSEGGWKNGRRRGVAGMTGRNGRGSWERQGITAFCTCQWIDWIDLPFIVFQIHPQILITMLTASSEGISENKAELAQHWITNSFSSLQLRGAFGFSATCTAGWLSLRPWSEPPPIPTMPHFLLQRKLSSCRCLGACALHQDDNQLAHGWGMNGCG